MINPSTMFEDLTAFLSWVTSSDASHIGCHWRCVCSPATYCACAYHETYAKGQISSIYLKSVTRFAYSLHKMALRLRQIKLSAKILYGSVLKTTLLSAHARNHVSLEQYGKYLTVIVLGDHDFLTSASNFGNLAAFMAMPYFCFRFSWSTDLERVSRVSSLTSKIFRPSLKLLRPSGRLVIAF